ncbi:putative Holliday junction resolvase [Winogradskyella psychrotolerans RS-3]|uniref:Putative Holliday junction resolvase n=1 Tax=Winogradskyella psychrotolerans RS-3 TaxID=641526 RepID=S7VSC2_9FLAO|nr:putative Holliday junction resolvase [Winogradskyella psychrotolerans RS-3]
MGRILAIDYGTKRTGLAVTDEMQMIASGLTTVDTKKLLEYLSTYISTENVEKIVVGLPKQMDNTASESEVYIQKVLEGIDKSNSTNSCRSCR